MHHAYLYIGEREWALSQLPPAHRTPSLDVSFIEKEKLTLSDVEELILLSSRTPLTSTHRTFVLLVDMILFEAQNALLKILEDPPQKVLFYFILPRDVLLATVRSRFFLAGIQILDDDVSRENVRVWEEFVKMSLAQRMTWIASLKEGEGGDLATSLLRGALLYVHDSCYTHSARDLTVALTYFHTPSASRKMLLEQLALSLGE